MNYKKIIDELIVLEREMNARANKEIMQSTSSKTNEILVWSNYIKKCRIALEKKCALEQKQRKNIAQCKLHTIASRSCLVGIEPTCGKLLPCMLKQFDA